MMHNAKPLNMTEPLGASVRRYTDEKACSEALIRWLDGTGVPRVTEWSAKNRRLGHPGESLAAPPTEGYATLTDGTYVRFAGTKNSEGDRIKETQGFSKARLPSALKSITMDWKRLSIPSKSPIPER